MSTRASTTRPDRLTPRLATAVLALCLATGSLPAPVGAQVIQDNLWIPDGPVQALAVDGNTLYIGGGFGKLAPATGSALVVDSSTTTPTIQQPLLKVAGAVYAARPDGAGGWYIGGEFRSVQGQLRHNLARIDANGNVTSWAPDVNGVVRAIAVEGSTVYVGGDFTLIGGQLRPFVGAIGSNAQPTAWNPNSSGSVYAIWVRFGSPNTVIVGGYFTSIGGASRSNVAILDNTNGAALAWSVDVAGGGVNALALSGTTLYMGGSFTSVASTARGRLAAVDVNTGALGAWNPNADSNVNALVVLGSVYVGGWFGQVGGQTRSCLAALDASTGLATAWDPSPNAMVKALTIWSDKLYVGGSFITIGGQSRYGVAVVSRTTGLATAWDPGVNGSVNAIATLNGSSVLVGGTFMSTGGVTRNRIAALDRTTGVPTAWDPSANSEVRGLVVAHGVVYACGAFTSIGGQSRNGLAALDGVTGAANGWDPGVPGVRSMAIEGRRLYLGGDFLQVAGHGPPYARLAAVDTASGALVTTFAPNASSSVSALAVERGVVYAAGNFTALGNQPRTYAGAVDTSAGLATGWVPAPGGVCQTLVVGGGRAYVGGNFSTIGGATRVRIAQLDTLSGNATGWAPNPSGTSIASAFAWSPGISDPPGVVYVGGSFVSLGGQDRRNLAAIDAVTGLATPWSVDADYGAVNTLLARGGLYVGGAFLSIGATPHAYLAWISDAPVAVGDTPLAPAGRRLEVTPNPFGGEVTLRFALPAAGRIRATVHDLGGRLVRRLHDGDARAGEQRLVWDGRDEAGHAVGAGVYFARVETGGTSLTARVLRLR